MVENKIDREIGYVYCKKNTRKTIKFTISLCRRNTTTDWREWEETDANVTYYCGWRDFVVSCLFLHCIYTPASGIWITRRHCYHCLFFMLYKSPLGLKHNKCVFFYIYHPFRYILWFPRRFSLQAYKNCRL